MSVGRVQYTIRVDGHLGAAMLSAFPELAAQEVTQTVLTGFLDRSALSGVLAQIETLNLDLVDVHQAPPVPVPTCPPAGRSLPRDRT